jgi:PA domain
MLLCLWPVLLLLSAVTCEQVQNILRMPDLNSSWQALLAASSDHTPASVIQLLHSTWQQDCTELQQLYTASECEAGAYLLHVAKLAAAAVEPTTTPRKAQASKLQAANLTFKDFFTDFAITAKPVHIRAADGSSEDKADKGSSSSYDAAAAAAAANLIKECYAVGYRGPLSSCDAVASALLVPAYCSNDYLQRTQTLSAESQITKQYRQSFATAYHMRTGSTAALHTCPAGTHMLVHQLEGSIKAMVFEHNNVPALQPSYGCTENGQPHIPCFGAVDPWKQDAGAAVTDALMVDDVLFAPSKAAVTWRAQSDAVLVQYCYVDAANLFNVIELMAYEKVSNPGALDMLAALKSPKLDTSMARDTAAVNLRTFWDQQHHHRQSSLASDTRTAAAAAVPSAGSTPDSRSSNNLSASTARRGRKAYKDWQETGRWNSLIVSLTLPVLAPPEITDVTRDHATIVWQSAFTQQPDDVTVISYNITWTTTITTTINTNAHAEHADRQTGLNGGCVHVQANDCRVDTETDTVKVDSTGTAIPLDDEVAAVFKYTLPAKSLIHDTSYTFSVALVYGDTVAPPSLPSQQITTLPITVPGSFVIAPEPEAGVHEIQLTVTKPIDDGGAAVTSWHIAAATDTSLQQQQQQHITPWFIIGVFEATVYPDGASVPNTDVIKIQHLIPGVAMRFKVSGENSMGTNEWSPVSSSCTPLSAAGDDVRRSIPIHGYHATDELKAAPGKQHISNTAYSRALSFTEDYHTVNTRAVHGLPLVLDDMSGTVQAAHTSLSLADKTQWDVWSGYHSPKQFVVKAELIEANPADASQPLVNALLARNRIVMIRRGGVPLVTKVLAAQNAGAIGVIVTDDGRCAKNGGFDQFCVPGSTSSSGWAQEDDIELWHTIKIPHVIMRQGNAADLIALASDIATNTAAAMIDTSRN